MAISIYIDADACPVKAEIYRVAERYGLKVYVVSNAYINVPRDPRIEGEQEFRAAAEAYLADSPVAAAFPELLAEFARKRPNPGAKHAHENAGPARAFFTAPTAAGAPLTAVPDVPA